MTLLRRPSCPCRPSRPALTALLALSLALPLQATAADAPGEPAAARSRAPVTVNFVNADIDAVTRAFAAMIGRQIAVDPRVRGTITVYSEQPISVREAYLTYLSALRGLGFAMVDNGGLLKVVPEADAKLQTGTVSVGEVNCGRPGHHADLHAAAREPEQPGGGAAPADQRPTTPSTPTPAATRWSSPTTRTTCAGWRRSSPRWTGRSDTDVDLISLKYAVASDLAHAGAAAGGAAAPVTPWPGRRRRPAAALSRWWPSRAPMR